MNKQQSIHVGMINSFNILTDRADLNQIVSSGIGVFAHIPDEDISKEVLDLIIYYFQEHEMFEHCSELMDYYNENFKEDGTIIENDCYCDYPEIEEYVKKMKCLNCGKRLKS